MGGIIWLSSYPKSGNTWTRAFLHNLFRDPKTAFDINEMSELTHNEAALVNFQPLDPRPWNEWTSAEVAAMRPRTHEIVSRSRPHNIFVKTHVRLMTLHGQPTVNMAVTAGAVYILRNPLDIVPSFADHQGLSLDQAIDVLNLTNYETPTTELMASEPMGSWSQHVESWTANPNPGLHVMRYEDMLESPSKAFGGLVRFLGLQAPRDRVERAVRNSSFKVLRKQEEKKGFAEKTKVQQHFFRRGEAGDWRRALSDDQVRRIVEAHREQMARWGYLPEGY